VRLKADTEPN